MGPRVMTKFVNRESAGWSVLISPRHVHETQTTFFKTNLRVTGFTKMWATNKFRRFSGLHDHMTSVPSVVWQISLILIQIQPTNTATPPPPTSKVPKNPHSNPQRQLLLSPSRGPLTVEGSARHSYTKILSSTYDSALPVPPTHTPYPRTYKSLNHRSTTSNDRTNRWRRCTRLWPTRLW